MKRLMVAMAAVALLAGCGKNDSNPAEKAEDAVITIAPGGRTYAELATNDVLVRVNGAELTKGEVERQIAFRIALAKMRPGKKLDAEREARMSRDMRHTCDRQFIMQELMKTYAERNGVQLSDADGEKMRERLVKAYVRGGNYHKFLRQLSPENRALLGQNTSRELWSQKGREKLIADNRRPVEDREIADRRGYFEKYNVRAKAAMAKAWQDATNVWKKATGGYPFEKLVAQYENGEVDHISAEAEWGDIKASDYKDDKELFRVLKTFPEGCIPPPFEGDNGLLVVKILKITPPDPANGKPEALFRLSKIFFELPELWEIETDEELRADLEKIHEREAFQKGIKALVDASKIDYPCGTNLFPRVSRRRSAIPAAARSRLPRGMKLPQ